MEGYIYEVKHRVRASYGSWATVQRKFTLEEAKGKIAHYEKHNREVAIVNADTLELVYKSPAVKPVTEDEIGCDYCREDGPGSNAVCPKCDAEWHD